MMKLFNNKTIEELGDYNSEGNNIQDLLILQKYNDTKSPALKAMAQSAIESLGIPEDANLDEFFRTPLVKETLNPVVRIINPAETLKALEVLSKQRDEITGDISGWVSKTQISVEHLCHTVRYPKEILGYPLNSQRNENDLVLENFTHKVWASLQEWWVGKDGGYRTSLEARLESVEEIEYLNHTLDNLKKKAVHVDGLRESSEYFEDNSALAQLCAEGQVFSIDDQPEDILQNIKRIITTDHTGAINGLIKKVDDDSISTEAFENHLAYQASEAFELVDGKNDKFFALAVENLPDAMGECIRSHYTELNGLRKVSPNKTIVDAMEMHAVCYDQLHNIQNSQAALVTGITNAIKGDVSVNRIKLVTSLLDQRESRSLVQENLLEYINTTDKVLSYVEESATLRETILLNDAIANMSLKEVALEVKDTESYIDFLGVLGTTEVTTDSELNSSIEAFNIAALGNKDYFEDIIAVESKSPEKTKTLWSAIKRFLDKIIESVKTAYRWLSEKVTTMWKWMMGTKPHVDAVEKSPKQTKKSDFNMDKGDPIDADGTDKPIKSEVDGNENTSDNSNFRDPSEGEEGNSTKSSPKPDYKTVDPKGKKKKGRGGGAKRGAKTKKFKKKTQKDQIKVHHPKGKSGGKHIVKVGLKNMLETQKYLYGYYGSKLLHIFQDIEVNIKDLDKLRGEVEGIIKKYSEGDGIPVISNKYDPVSTHLRKQHKKDNAPLMAILSRMSVNTGYTVGTLTKDAALKIATNKFISVNYIGDVNVHLIKLNKAKDSFSKLVKNNEDKPVMAQKVVSNATKLILTSSVTVINAMLKVQQMEKARTTAIAMNNATIVKVQEGRYE